MNLNKIDFNDYYKLFEKKLRYQDFQKLPPLMTIKLIDIFTKSKKF